MLYNTQLKLLLDSKQLKKRLTNFIIQRDMSNTPGKNVKYTNFNIVISWLGCSYSRIGFPK